MGWWQHDKTSHLLPVSMMQIELRTDSRAEKRVATWLSNVYPALLVAEQQVGGRPYYSI